MAGHAAQLLLVLLPLGRAGGPGATLCAFDYDDFKKPVRPL